MSRSRNPAALVLLGAIAIGVAMSSCGADPDEGVTIAVRDRALLRGASSIAVYLYRGDASCAEVRGAWPRPAPVIGPVERRLTQKEQETGVMVTFDAIPAGVYVVFADALDEEGRSLGSGCAPAQLVSSRTSSRTRVEISG